MLNTLHFILLVLILTSLLVHHSVDAFYQAAVEGQAKSRLTTTIAMAWSLQTPEFPKSTWYDDVGYPTFRRRVYDDDSTEFRFSYVGSNWPDYDAIEKEAAAAAEDQAKRRRAPRLRPWQRVRKLINSRRP